MASLNPLITVVVQLRDSNSEIDSYLSHGKMSIPKLIERSREELSLKENSIIQKKINQI